MDGRVQDETYEDLAESEVLVCLILYTTVHKLRSRLKSPQNGIYWIPFLLTETERNLKESVRFAQSRGK
jgi:hypothetical protein